MEEKQSVLKRIIAKLTKYYRVELIDDLTLSQSRIFIFRPIKILSVIFIAVLVLIGGTSSLIFFVPAIRQQIPGYVNPDVKQQQKQLLENVKILGQQVEMRDSLIKTLQRSLMEGQAIDFSQNAGNNISIPTLPVEETEEIGVENIQQETYEEEYPDYPPQQSVKTSNYQYSPLQNLFRPVPRGQISKEFDENAKHYGVDIVAKENELVLAAADGFVIMAEYLDQSGQVLGILSQGNVLTFYKHNETLYKKTGDFVKAGEPVAVMGNSGENSTGPHLHFELWHKGIPVDPAQYINFQ